MNRALVFNQKPNAALYSVLKDAYQRCESDQYFGVSQKRMMYFEIKSFPNIGLACFKGTDHQEQNICVNSSKGSNLNVVFAFGHSDIGRFVFVQIDDNIIMVLDIIF